MAQKRLKAPKEVKQLQKQLKALTTKWAPLVIEEMAKEDPSADKIKLYNILNGSIRDKQWHNIFIKGANTVIKKLEKKQAKQVA